MCESKGSNLGRNNLREFPVHSRPVPQSNRVRHSTTAAADSYTQSHTNAHTQSHTNPDTYTNAHTNPNSYTQPNSDASTWRSTPAIGNVASGVHARMEPGFLATQLHAV